jgi:hypothetical protein
MGASAFAGGADFVSWVCLYLVVNVRFTLVYCLRAGKGVMGGALALASGAVVYGVIAFPIYLWFWMKV